MNSSARGIWSDLPISTGIATLVCYAGVFGDVIGTEEMATRLGLSGQAEFYSALNELHRQRRIILRDGFVGLPDLTTKIDLKVSKMEMTRQLIASRLEDIRKLGRNPFIKFVGISGSLAANNPTKDRHTHLDVDIFLITRSQCLWLYVIPRNIRNLFPRRKKEPELCINYVTDESNLKITNRNFFTATEMRNLIPISGPDAYRKLLHANNWADYYYPGLSGTADAVVEAPSAGLINKSLFAVFKILYCLKHFTINPLREISFKTNPHCAINFNRLCLPYGGYQALVHKNFTRLAAAWFPDLLGVGFIEKLFPDELSVGIRSGAIDAYKLTVDAGRLDYSKYGLQQVLPKGS